MGRFKVTVSERPEGADAGLAAQQCRPDNPVAQQCTDLGPAAAAQVVAQQCTDNAPAASAQVVAQQCGDAGPAAAAHVVQPGESGARVAPLSD
jgi:hypothetical protein